MKKLEVNSIDELEDLVLNPQVSKEDKYFIFKQVLNLFPIIFIDIILDDSEAINGIEDKDNRLVNDMLKIITEIREDPTAKHYSGLSVIRNDSSDRVPHAVIIDFTD
jgi:hypothetical protein